MLGCEALALAPPLPLTNRNENLCNISAQTLTVGLSLCAVNVGLFHPRAASSVSSAAPARSWVRHTPAQTHSCPSCQLKVPPRSRQRQLSVGSCADLFSALAGAPGCPPPLQLMIPSSCSGRRVSVYTYKTQEPFTPPSQIWSRREARSISHRHDAAMP